MTTVKVRTEKHRREVEVRIVKAFAKIGIPANINGYRYLKTAILEVYEDEDIVHKMTKHLYPLVAQKFGTVGSCVERGIRHAIEVAWNRGDPEIQEEYFGYTISYNRSKPTNGEFIARVVDLLKLQML